MSDAESGSAASLRQWQLALSRWDNEGGAGPAGPQWEAVSAEAQSKMLQLTNAELVHLGSVHTVMQHYVHGLGRGATTPAEAGPCPTPAEWRGPVSGAASGRARRKLTRRHRTRLVRK